ncbi:uncharacterized protein [Anabrus simplex]|uniref:uncharacterized protein n=1 Tax=Anabrus simplex TaxID=316456 RepID=UPI0034DD7696
MKRMNYWFIIMMVALGVFVMVLSSPTDKRVLLDLQMNGEPLEVAVETKQEALDEKMNFAEPAVNPILRSEPVRVVKAWRGGKKLPRYQRRLVDRGRKVKYLKKGPGENREQADASVYVVDETITGYVPSTHLEEDLVHAQNMGFMDPSDELLYVRHRLQKLDFYFAFMKVMSEDCRQRMLCEVSREPSRFYPLSSVLEDVTSFNDGGTYQYVTSQLINTTEGARLLSYMEASFRGQDRTRTCAVFQYRCPSRTEHMINYEALCLWREMVRWLTIHVVAKTH